MHCHRSQHAERVDAREPLAGGAGVRLSGAEREQPERCDHRLAPPSLRIAARFAQLLAAEAEAAC
jgi:hypothetical protein